ncbi:centrosome and spindle pole-associated protein 1 [Cariama cristata]
MLMDDLDKFIEGQKAKLAREKAELESDPPYMEMRNKESEQLCETSKMLISMTEEKIPPNSHRNYPLGDNGLSLPLGEEYEQKNHKLREERGQDYKQYLSQGISQAKRKKKYLTVHEVDPYTQGLSLPIDERRSAKEKLRLERNKEYNQYLRDKEERNERLRKLGRKTTENEMDRNEKPIAVTRLQPELRTEVQPCTTGAGPPKKNAFTSTEGYEELQNKRWLEEDRYHRLDDEAELHSQLLSKRLDEDLDVPNRRWGFAGQSVIPTRKHHRLDEDCDFGRRYYRMDYDPEISEEMDPRFRCESTYDRRTPRIFYTERPCLDGIVRNVPADYEDEIKERAHVQHISRTGNSRNRVQICSSANKQAKSAADVPYATGLVLGGEDQELLQRKKEKYRQELLEQIAEQRRNKRREKELELSVAASGAQDRENTLSDEEANRLKQFGFPVRASEEKIPPGRPGVAFQTPIPVSSASRGTEDFHQGLASALGEISAPRFTPVPPPLPPVLTDNRRMPYGERYYFCGVRNPLDLHLAYYGADMTGMQPTPNLDPPLGQAPVEQSVSNIGQRNTGNRQRSIGVFSEEKSKPSKEAMLSYQQELQQQIRERAERRRQEREEEERYEAKLEAEMRSYNPWGKGGGGAPLRDAEGNLISNLNIMHKQNEDAYHNREARLHEDKRAIASVDLSLASPRPENREASTNKPEGFTFAQTSAFARGNVFREPPSPQHLKQQESYRNCLLLQIEEKRRRKEEEQEKLRIEEEKEEKRLAEERMRIQKEYEDEQEEKRRKEEEQRLKNKEMIQLNEKRRKEAEKRRKEEEEKQDEQLRQYIEKAKMEEEKKMFSRRPSPILPALQNKSIREDERTPSAESHVSSYTQDPPRPRVPSPPVPARRNQLCAEERKKVIDQLAEMRRWLDGEKRQLQEQLLNMATDDDVPIIRRTREKKARYIFERARLGQPVLVRRASSKKSRDPVNIQNIREFNELKHKDSETCMGSRHLYHDPPKDDLALEIEQQALLREQQKKIDRMRRRRETEDDQASGDNPQTMGLFQNEPNELLRNSLLESESVFIGANGATFPDLEVNLSRQLPPSARERRRIKQKALECAENVPPPQTQTPPPPPQPDSFSLCSSFSLDVDQLQRKSEERLHRLTELQQKSRDLDDTFSLEGDDLLKPTPSSANRRPASVDTVATEPWLRPGTSETLQRSVAKQE